MMIVTFKTYDGLTLTGTLFSAGDKRPCVIMTIGTLHSGSRRRDLQSRDYLDAFNYAATLPEVDAAKMVYWGSSMSGGAALFAAALNTNIAATIAQVPFTSGDFTSAMTGKAPGDLVLERGNAVATGRPTLVQSMAMTEEEALSGTCKAVLPDPAGGKFIEEMHRRGYKVERNVTVQSLAYCAMFEPVAYIQRIAPTPLLMVVAEHDVTARTHVQLEAFAKAREPKTLLLLKGQDHFSVYYEEKAFEENIKGQIEFLNKTLGA
ncbi:hydrolases of the alpha beta superfamily [Pyrenophora seminiperda CCB06]|uniref:Hydrolases of the alpha beta superfamily n=1 Tax=Pyrenophora seminiperda CCB06 TaxID=1302712 RepID=A0A3M7M4J9_9PLEO|nr:hydrolases of the alpha beta superfamily [Pyrenophora seminiperda CCB06]